MKSRLNVTGASSNKVAERLEAGLDLTPGLFSEDWCDTVYIAYGEEAVQALRDTYESRCSGSRANEHSADVILGQREGTLRNRFPATKNARGPADILPFLIH